MYVSDQSNIFRILDMTPSLVARLDVSYPNPSRTGSFLYGSVGNFIIDTSGSIFVAGEEQHTITYIAADRKVFQIAGLSRVAGSSEGIGTAARFRFPSGVALDAGGVLYVADAENHTIRRGVPIKPARIVRHPQSSEVTVGSTIALSVTTASDETYVYQWYKNGVKLQNETFSTLTIFGALLSSSGRYSVVVSNPAGQVLSEAASLIVSPEMSSGSRPRLANMSIRYMLSAEKPLVVGFVVGGKSPSDVLPVLIRAAGPSLRNFGILNGAEDPQLIVRMRNSIVDHNDNWNADSRVASLAASVGAFPFARGSLDAAVASDLSHGDYTAQVQTNGQHGMVLTELYESSSEARFRSSTARLSNLSVRCTVGSGTDILLVGFYVVGESPITLLLRAVGPSLSQFLVPDASPDPALLVHAVSSGEPTLVAKNDDWSGSQSISEASRRSGAFELNDFSKDAALVVSLSPGPYTAQVTSRSVGEATVLFEMYELR
jgi:hypothetical protein